MISEVRVAAKGTTDPKGEELLTEIKRTLKIKSINKIRTAKIYYLEGLNSQNLKKLVNTVLVEPIDNISSINQEIFKNAHQIIKIGYKPSVMNPEVQSILKSAKDLNIKPKAVDSAWEYAFWGNLSNDELEKMTNKLLLNETVEQIILKKPKTLIIYQEAHKTEIIPIRNLQDHELLDLSKDRLFLNLEEMKIIKNYFNKINRDPTDCEIEVLAQTWSEHCVHKTFQAALTINGKKKRPFIVRIKDTVKHNKKLIVSSFVDNSGVIDFYDGFAISGKVETHNSPSAIEPYGGAMTGSGGVFRDVLGTGQGAKPIISTDIFCFAPPNLPPSEVPPGCLSPNYLLRKVVAGVRDYGNRVGIPTNNGSVHFHNDFRAKPTVAVGSYGLIPKKQAKKGSPKKGDLIITIGGRTGRDGIHGATFSSGEMSSQTMQVSGSAVQIGNAIEEKRVIDFVIALRNQKLINAITDCGAGGYSSAVGEMGSKTGATVNLEKVPLKYAGLSPWEIFLSESQERMVIAITPANLNRVLKFSKLFNVETKIIGKFDGFKRLKVYYKKQKVCDLTMNFLHHGLPQRKMKGKSREVKIIEKLPKPKNNLINDWLKVLAHGNVCSKEPIVRMYDHNVQGTCALHPFTGENFESPNDGAVVRPIYGKHYGVVVTHGLNPTLNSTDPYWGSIWAITEAVSNYVSIGGDLKNAALIDNFIWPFPDEESLADLDRSVDACCYMAKLLKMPFVSGKDSLSSTYRYSDGKTLKIPPVLLISVFGKIPNVSKTVSSDFKKTGSTLVLVGFGDHRNLGGSAYFDISRSSGQIPKVNLKNLKSVLSSITDAVKTGKILSCHDISEGGLASTISEMCFGAGFGARVDLSKIDSHARSDLVFFSESAGAFLVEVEDKKAAKKLFAKVPHTIIGKTENEKKITVSFGKKIIAAESISKLKAAWQKPMKEIFHA